MPNVYPRPDVVDVDPRHEAHTVGDKDVAKDAKDKAKLTANTVKEKVSDAAKAVTRSLFDGTKRGWQRMVDERLGDVMARAE